VENLKALSSKKDIHFYNISPSQPNPTQEHQIRSFLTLKGPLSKPTQFWEDDVDSGKVINKK